MPLRRRPERVRQVARGPQGFEPRVFNVGAARRKLPGYSTQDVSFFSGAEEKQQRVREELAMSVLKVRRCALRACMCGGRSHILAACAASRTS